MTLLKKFVFQILLLTNFFAKTLLPNQWYENYKEKWRSFITNSGFADPYTSQDLNFRMWAGFSRDAVNDLEDLKRSSVATNRKKADAATLLAKWYAYNEDYSSTLSNLQFIKQISKTPKLLPTMIEAETFMRVGRDREAKAIIQNTIQKNKYDTDLYLMAANTLINDEKPFSDLERLSWINEIYHSKQLAGIQKIYEEKPLGFFNFSNEPVTSPSLIDTPKISIIMPAYNAQVTLPTVIQSVLNQTWKNIELLVVDDCSTDATFEIVSEFSKRDSRVIPIRHKTNQGTYSARNTALALATGDYITVNDSDDWSHPQKIESQINGILKSPSIIGTTSKLVRVSEKLYFNNSWRLGKELIRENTSAIMIPREWFDLLGGWDQVRSSGDSELYERIKKLYGNDSIKVILPRIPFSFCLDLDTNLTKRSDSHIRTLYFGARNDYRETATWWHDNAKPSELKINPSSTERPFAIPERIKIVPKNEPNYDIVLITDFSARKELIPYVYDLLKVCLQLNKRIAIFNYPNYKNFDKESRYLNPEIYRLLNHGDIDRISIGDSIKAEWVMICDPRLLHYKIDSIPAINFKKLFVIVDELTNIHTKFDQRDFDPEKIVNNLKELCGVEGTWIATSDSTIEKLKAHLAFPKPFEKPWYPYVDPGSIKEKTNNIQGAEVTLPTIGGILSQSSSSSLHSKQDVLDLYCANQECKTILHDDNKTVRKLIGKIPDNWEITSSPHKSSADILQNLDFYIHYPTEKDLLTKVKNVLIALSSECVVISSPEYQNIFEDAVVYAQPKDVWKRVSEYWNDKNKYDLQTRKGKAFLKDFCDPKKILSIFEKLN